MSREQANVRVTIWAEEFRLLSRDAQHLYFVLLTSPQLSYCGVTDWRPARIAKLAADLTVTEVRVAARELAGQLYIVIDEDSEEVLLRSFIRNDGLLRNPKMGPAVARAWTATASAVLRGVVAYEATRLRKERPDLGGWTRPEMEELLAATAINPAELALTDDSDPEASLTALPIGSVTASGTASVMTLVPDQDPDSQTGTSGITNRIDARSYLLPTTSTLEAKASKNSSSSKNDDEGERIDPSTRPPRRPRPPKPPSDNDPDFARFWDAYPRKTGKGQARNAWPRAIRKTDPATITAAAQRYRDDPNLPEPRFVPHPATWLNGERWADTATQPDARGQRRPGGIVAPWEA